jgi:hypothetical protein
MSLRKDGLIYLFISLQLVDASTSGQNPGRSVVDSNEVVHTALSFQDGPFDQMGASETRHLTNNGLRSLPPGFRWNMKGQLV